MKTVGYIEDILDVNLWLLKFSCQLNKTGLQYFLANVLSVKCRCGLLYFPIKLPLSNLFDSAIGFRKGLPKRFRWENSKTLRLLNWVWYFSLKLLVQTFSIWPFICRCKYAWRIYQTSLAVHKKGCLRGSAKKAANYLIYEVVLIATMDGNTSSENDSARYYRTLWGLFSSQLRFRHKQRSECSIDDHIYHCQYFGVNRHFGNAYASFTVLDPALQPSCVRVSGWNCRTTALYR